MDEPRTVCSDAGPIVVRELRYTIHEKGFRPKEITLVTTLLDADRYSCSDLADQFQSALGN